MSAGLNSLFLLFAHLAPTLDFHRFHVFASVKRLHRSEGSALHQMSGRGNEPVLWASPQSGHESIKRALHG